jgi:hypothetical protein
LPWPTLTAAAAAVWSSGTRQLVSTTFSGGRPVAAPSWSPDGRLVAARAYETLPDGRQVEQVLVVDPAFDGRGIAYVETSGTNIAVQPLDGGPPRLLTRFPDLTIVDFAFSADGTRLAVTRQATTTDIVLFKGLR